MTKAQKKQIISDLLKEAQETADINIAEEKLTCVVQEIYSSGFNLQMLKLVSKAIETFIRDIPDKALERESDEFQLASSKTALLTLIDLSQLPD